MRYIGFLIPLLFLACTPEHSTGEEDARITFTADATADAGEIDPDGSFNDARLADANRNDANGLDAGVIPDANQDDAGQTADANRPDTATFPDAGAPDAAGTDAWVNPYCQPQGQSQASVSIAPLIDDWTRSPIILFGETDAHIASFLFVAYGENVNLCTLTFELCASGQTNGSGQCSSPASEQQRYPSMGSNFRLEYEDDTGTSQEAYASLDGNRLVFPGVNVYAQKDNWSVVRLYADAPESGAGVQSGDQLRVNLVSAPDELIMIGRSTLGLVAIPQARTYYAFPAMEFRRSKLHLSRTSTDYGTRNLGWNRVITLMISAENTGGLAVDGFLFNSQTVDNSGTSWNRCQNLGQGSRWRIVDANNTSQILSDDGDWRFYNADGQPCLNNQIVAYVEVDMKRDATTGPSDFAAGETRELTVQLDMSINGVNDYIRLELLDEEAADLIRMDPEAFSAVSWSDLEAEDIDADYLKELPLNCSVGIIE